MMAVVLIMGLLLALIAPNLRIGGASALRDEALEVARRLELARQLAVTSGRPHRLLVDLENGELASDDEIEIDLPGTDDIEIDDEQLLVLADEVVESADTFVHLAPSAEPADDKDELFETGQFDLSADLDEE